MRRALLILVAAAATLAPAGRAVDGAGLFAEGCSRCHGVTGTGVPDQGPALTHAGALAADFYLRTGYMPLSRPGAQPSRRRVLYSEDEIRGIVAYVASLGRGPRIPSPHWRQASVSAGLKLFTDHCAGCHQVVAQGGYVTGARVPPLGDATAREIAEAVRIGPYLMPRFSQRAISATQLNDLVAYVQYTKHPEDPGGWAIGHLGPWPEGVVTWLLAAAVLVGMCTVFGRRLKA
jgi:ubiquinol-cytochrome c reductase cytochrome c subunit